MAGETFANNPSAAVARLLDRLDRVGVVSGGWCARCPAHDDRVPSLSVTAGPDGRVLLHCHAGCTPEAVVGAVGLSMADLYDGPSKRPARPTPRSTRYEIKDVDGRTVAIHERIDGVKGKRFVWLGPDGTRGLDRRAVDLPLYLTDRLPTGPPEEPVFVVEGERAADALVGLGLCAVGTVTGAASAPSGLVLAVLVGRDLRLWPDNDAVGVAHMHRIAERLEGVAASVSFVHWSEAPEHGDAADFCAEGSSPADVLALPIRSAHLGDGEWAERIPPVADGDQIHSAHTSTTRRAERILPFRTAREFAAATPSDVDWIARPYVAAGAITGVEGKIKIAGKTTLVTHLCRAVLDGRPFLGRPTKRAGVVYLTEQPASSLREALRRADLLERDDFTILSWRDCAGLAWAEVVEAAVAECGRRGAGLLVVDTLGRFAGIRGDGENSAGEAEAAMAPLQVAAADGLGIIVVRHERKAGGDVGDSGRGSSAFGGAVDIVMAVRRGDRDTQSNVRVIHALSRFDETPETLGVELTAQGYVPIGDGLAIAQRQAEASLLQILPTDPSPGIPVDDLVELTGSPRTTVQRALDGLLGAGRVVRTGAGRKGDPYRFVARIQAADGEVAPASVPLNYGIFGDEEEWGMGTA